MGNENIKKLTDAIEKVHDANLKHILRTIHNEAKIESLSALVIDTLSKINNTEEKILIHKLNLLLEERLGSNMEAIDSILDVMKKP